jgi:hypothetical protein
MHPYSTDSEERFQIAFALAVIAVGLAWLVALVTGKTHPPFWLEVPGTATLYGLLLGIFRSYIWNWAVLHTASIVKVPDISGDWRGYVTSSFDSLAEQHPVTVRIRQNWTHLSLRLSTEHSDSESVVASMVMGNQPVLSYQYRNVPRTGAKETMHAHDGTATLNLIDGQRQLSGEYYSGRDRANQGILVLEKQ